MISKNNPRLGGLLLDVIPRRFERDQPLDKYIIAPYYTIINKYLSIMNSKVHEFVGSKNDA